MKRFIKKYFANYGIIKGSIYLLLALSAALCFVIYIAFGLICSYSKTGILMLKQRSAKKRVFQS